MRVFDRPTLFDAQVCFEAAMHALLLLSMLSAVDAPIVEVTVFSDRARVVRVATVAAGGANVEFAPLPETVDASSIRLEASGAEVKRFELTQVGDDVLPVSEARALLQKIWALDDSLSKVRSEKQAHQTQSTLLRKFEPAAPVGDPLKPAPKLNAQAWPSVLKFLSDQTALQDSRCLELEEKELQLGRQRDELAEKVRLMGATRSTRGWKVTAALGGSGSAKLTLTYLVMRARWYPVYDVQLMPEGNQVRLSFAGLVSQETGEDWPNAALTLSTAVPLSAPRLPEVRSWKIGEKERFIPTAHAVVQPVTPAPTAPGEPFRPREEDTLRAKLVAAAHVGTANALAGDEKKKARVEKRTFQFQDGEADRAPSAPVVEPAPVAPEQAFASESLVVLRAGSARREVPTAPFSLSPPPGGYRPASEDPSLPAGAAGGYDLSYSAIANETVPTGSGARRVALFSQTWPVSVERKIFPALSPEAFLVAELKNPSTQPLPAGGANLFVGADPSGTSRLGLVSPGEKFTLPLGIDRALRPIRNVQVTQTEKGVINKDEISEYAVTIEIANPYRAPTRVRVLDQWPLSDQKEVKVTLLDSQPAATQDKLRGQLEWQLTLAPASKTVLKFRYAITKPKGWRMQQQEVAQ